MADIVMPTISNILKKAGVLPNGKTQVFVTNEAQRLMRPYVPVLSHALRNSARSVDSSTAIEYQSPYAHYQYMGVRYVDPITKKGSFYSPTYGHWSRKGVNKEATTIPLKYHGGGLTGAKWDEAMMQDREQDLINAANNFIRKG